MNYMPSLRCNIVLFDVTVLLVMFVESFARCTVSIYDDV